MILLFHFILNNYIPTQHGWKLLYDLIFSKLQHYINVWLFNKNLSISLKEFATDSINYLGWELGIEFEIEPTEYLPPMREVSWILIKLSCILIWRKKSMQKLLSAWM